MSMSMSWWSSPTNVLVTGAGGQTGSIVVRKLLERTEQGKEQFITRALVRSQDSGDKLKTSVGEMASSLEIVQGDISQPETLKTAFSGVKTLVICTSAMPQISKLSLPGVIFTKVCTLGLAGTAPSFYFDEGGTPEEVDWRGQKAQIDEAKAAGVKYIVLVSSMAGTKPEHFLNVSLDNIVLWKRRAECYLRACTIPSTIIHPGGLLPHSGWAYPAPGGKRTLHVALNDVLMDDERKINTVTREDLAEVIVQCIASPSEASGRSFDLGSGPEMEEAVAPISIKELLAPLEGKNCAYTPKDAAFTVVGPERGDSCGFCSAK